MDKSFFSISLSFGSLGSETLRRSSNTTSTARTNSNYFRVNGTRDAVVLLDIKFWKSVFYSEFVSIPTF